MNIGNYIKYYEMSIKIMSGGHVSTQHNMSLPLFIGPFFSSLPDRAEPARLGNLLLLPSLAPVRMITRY